MLSCGVIIVLLVYLFRGFPPDPRERCAQRTMCESARHTEYSKCTAMQKAANKSLQFKAKKHRSRLVLSAAVKRMLIPFIENKEL